MADLDGNSIIAANDALAGPEGMAPSRGRPDELKLLVYLADASTGVDFAPSLSAFACGASDEAQSIEELECLIPGCGDQG